MGDGMLLMVLRMDHQLAKMMGGRYYAHWRYREVNYHNDYFTAACKMSEKWMSELLIPQTDSVLTNPSKLRRKKALR